MKYIYYILIAAGLLLAGGCSQDTPDGPAPERADMCELVVSLCAEANVAKNPETRADQPWADPYPEEPGFPSEYSIDHVSLYLVTGGNTVIPFFPSPLGNTGNTYTYQVKVNRNASYVSRNDDGTLSLSGRIVAIANYPDGATPAEPLGDVPYQLSHIDRSGRIPMWGVTTINNLTLVVNSSVYAGEIKLLRSVPKVTIEMADDLKDRYKITAVVPDQTDYLSVANCFPTGGATATTTGSLLIEGCFNGSSAQDHIAPVFYNMGTDKVWTYLAERECPLTADGKPLGFTVTLERTDGVVSKPFTGKVYLCDYTNGAPAPDTAFRRLVRNHDYQYKISLKELEFIVSFKEWIFGGKVHVDLE